MNQLDLSLLKFLNGLEGQFPHIDVLVLAFNNNNLLANALLVSAWWFAYFSLNDANKRRSLVVSLIYVCVSVGVCQLLQHAIPPRVRPFNNPELGFVIPAWTGKPPDMHDWSAFPSDHAVLWYALALGVFLVSRRVGGLLLVYATVLSTFRVYLGFHHPTDMFAGAAIALIGGTAFVSYFKDKSPFIRISALSERYPGQFFMLLFLLTYQIANTFDESRDLLSYVKRFIGFLT